MGELANIVSVRIEDFYGGNYQTFPIDSDKNFSECVINSVSEGILQTFPINSTLPILIGEGNGDPIWVIGEAIYAEKINVMCQIMKIGDEWKKGDKLEASRLNKMCTAASVNDKKPVSNWYPWNAGDGITANRLNDMIAACGNEGSIKIETIFYGTRCNFPIETAKPISNVLVETIFYGTRYNFPIETAKPISNVLIEKI